MAGDVIESHLVTDRGDLVRPREPLQVREAAIDGQSVPPVRLDRRIEGGRRRLGGHQDCPRIFYAGDEVLPSRAPAATTARSEG